MKRGVPPTPLNARTGLFTPPGNSVLAFSKIYLLSGMILCGALPFPL